MQQTRRSFVAATAAVAAIPLAAAPGPRLMIREPVLPSGEIGEYMRRVHEGLLDALAIRIGDARDLYRISPEAITGPWPRGLPVTEAESLEDQPECDGLQVLLLSPAEYNAYLYKMARLWRMMRDMALIQK